MTQKLPNDIPYHSAAVSPNLAPLRLSLNFVPPVHPEAGRAPCRRFLLALALLFNLKFQISISFRRILDSDSNSTPFHPSQERRRVGHPQNLGLNSGVNC